MIIPIPVYQLVLNIRLLMKQQKVCQSFDSSKNELNDSVLYFDSEIEINTSQKNADVAFDDRIKSYEIGARIGKSKLEEIDNLPKYYDNFYVAIKKQEDRIIGNVIVVQSGKKIISLLIDGAYISDPYLIMEFLDTVMLDIVNYKLEKQDQLMYYIGYNN